MEIYELSIEEFEALIKKSVEDAQQLLSDNPEIKMPVFVSRKPYKITWNN